MKIGIFGGSFNPVHKAHIAIAKYAIQELNLDKLIFVPAYKSPFKKKNTYVKGEQRAAMLDLVKPAKSEVSFFELNRKGVSFTIDTVKYLKQKYSQDQLFLLVGSDHLAKLNKWRNIEEIVQLATIVIFKRSKTYSKENIKKFKCLVLNNPIYEASSSTFKKGDFSQIDPLVNEYIGRHALYIPELMLGMLDSRRHKHSVSVAQYAVKFAKVKNIDPARAWIAGALHDITKCWPLEKHRTFLAKYTDQELADHELHSWSGYYWIKNEYKLGDEEVAEAVLKHTTLAKELTAMDKVLYAADKLAYGRAHPGIQKDRELMITNFDEGFKKLVKIIYDLLLTKREISQETKDIYLHLLKS